jgi:hypothetical protein
MVIGRCFEDVLKINILANTNINITINTIVTDTSAVQNVAILALHNEVKFRYHWQRCTRRNTTAPPSALSLL